MHLWIHFISSPLSSSSKLGSEFSWFTATSNHETFFYFFIVFHFFFFLTHSMFGWNISFNTHLRKTLEEKVCFAPLSKFLSLFCLYASSIFVCILNFIFCTLNFSLKVILILKTLLLYCLLVCIFWKSHAILILHSLDMIFFPKEFNILHLSLLLLRCIFSIPCKNPLSNSLWVFSALAL